MFAVDSNWDQQVQELKCFGNWTGVLAMRPRWSGLWVFHWEADCGFSGAAVLQMLKVTWHWWKWLIIMKDSRWSFWPEMELGIWTTKPVWLKLLPRASSDDGLKALLLVLLLIEVQLCDRANWLLMVVPLLMVWDCQMEMEEEIKKGVKCTLKAIAAHFHLLRHGHPAGDFSFQWPVNFTIELRRSPAAFNFFTVFLALRLGKVFYESFSWLWPSSCNWAFSLPSAVACTKFARMDLTQETDRVDRLHVFR